MAHKAQSEHCIHRECSSTSKRKPHSRHSIQVWDLDSVAGREESVLQMDANHGDEHDADHQCPTGWGKQPQRQQQAAEKLSQTCGRREHYARTEANALKKTACAFNAIASEPAE